jgi:proteic killer suppression protein
VLNENAVVIKNIQAQRIEKVFESKNKSGIQAAHAKRIELILDLLDGADEVKDMNFPGSNFHPLKGNLIGRSSFGLEMGKPATWI